MVWGMHGEYMGMWCGVCMVSTWVCGYGQFKGVCVLTSYTIVGCVTGVRVLTAMAIKSTHTITLETAL